MFLPNRVVAVAGALIALALGVLPVVGNFDWTSTAGVIAGAIAVLGIVQKWLGGWQQHEQRQHDAAILASPEPVEAKALPVKRVRKAK